jgi:hypothetical protein
MKEVIQITTENHIEEQYILEKFPEAVWFNLTGRTNFYLPTGESYKTEVESVILEWEERNEK